MGDYREEWVEEVVRAWKRSWGFPVRVNGLRENEMGEFRGA